MSKYGFLANVVGIHDKLANDVYPNGAVVTCSKCERTFDADKQQIAYYFAHGWPKCCGYTMTIGKKAAL